MRTRICIGCGAPTTNGSRCSACQPRRRPGANPYRHPAYLAARKRLIEQHVREHGEVCPRCGGHVQPGVPRTMLSADHIVPLAEGGAIDGPMRVLCVGCNSSTGNLRREARRGVDRRSGGQR